MSADRYAVIGDPISHSLSPAMHNAAFRAAGISAEYQAERVSCHDLTARFADLSHAYRGFNVTIPHKETVVALVDVRDHIVETLGAANTVSVRGGRVEASNTDPAGFQRALESARVGLDGRRAVVLGAGGAARAVTYALNLRGIRPHVYARSPERVERLSTLGAIPGSSQLDDLASADLIVNCTPLGMGRHAAQSPLPDGAILRPGVVVMDLVYGRSTPFLREAERQGAVVMDGLEMLIFQGAESFRMWTGLEPNIDVMREACRLALEAKRCCAS
ncbi:MAG TPA: shikimate dehydrogenase [Chloroflexota bacterium]|nr:shikimate dehydrogenase [Chloroflexota bacterium]